MSIADWATVAGVVAATYLGWQQNRIFKEQNRIFANQSRRTAMQSDDSLFRFLKLYWPTVVMVLLILLTGYDIYDRHHYRQAESLPEFDAAGGTELVEGYGFDDPKLCFMQVNGAILLSRQAGYKLAIGCYIYDGRQDMLDAPFLQVSNLYDIKNADIIMRVAFTDFFQAYRKQEKATGINIALLNVPNGVQPSQFTTLRQARALGVLIPAARVSVAGKAK